MSIWKVIISSTKLKINRPENCDVLTKICMYFKVENLISWFAYWAPLGCRRERELSYYRNSGHAHQQLHHCTVHSVQCFAVQFYSDLFHWLSTKTHLVEKCLHGLLNIVHFYFNSISYLLSLFFQVCNICFEVRSCYVKKILDYLLWHTEISH